MGRQTQNVSLSPAEKAAVAWLAAREQRSVSGVVRWLIGREMTARLGPDWPALVRRQVESGSG